MLKRITATVLGLTLIALLAIGLHAQSKAAPENSPAKSLGTKTAPITMEVFSDYQCPTCKMFYEQTLRLVFQNYVNAGKVFYIHHDLPFHQFSHEAARYANAAARVGEFETVSTALFSRQDTWGTTGGVESCVEAALTPAQMARLKKVMQANKTQIENDIQSDVALGQGRFKVRYTPTTVISCRGQSYTVVGMVSYPILRQFLEELAKR